MKNINELLNKSETKLRNRDKDDINMGNKPLPLCQPKTQANIIKEAILTSLRLISKGDINQALTCIAESYIMLDDLILLL